MNSEYFMTIDKNSAKNIFVGRIPTVGEKIEMVVVETDNNNLIIKLQVAEQNLDSEPFF